LSSAAGFDDGQDCCYSWSSLLVPDVGQVAPARFIVTHGNHEPGTLCLPGETVEKVSLLSREREFPLPLSPTGLLLFDCICRYRLTPLTSSRIEKIMKSDLFYLNHGANLHDRRVLHQALPSRASIKVYVYRIRQLLAKALAKAEMLVAAQAVLVSEETDSNVVVYGIKATVETLHIGLTCP